jgi:hypothetical protein
VKAVDQDCQISLGTTYQNGKKLPNDHKMYQMTINITNLRKNILICGKIYQMAIKYANIFHYIQDPPKFTQSGILGLKIYHLATLLSKTISM